MQVNTFGNEILGQLDPEALALLAPHLREVTLENGIVLFQEGAAIEHVYFPTKGLISLVITSEEGDSVEVGLAGQEGMAGSSIAFGLPESFCLATVQIAGTGLRMPAGKFAAAYEESASVRRVVNRYHMQRLAHAQQSAACNAIHPVAARMCRWLLEVRDRVGTDRLQLRQEFLAQMLGVQRTTVTLTEGNLKAAGLVHIGRGYIEIKNVDGIRRSACGCYASLRRRLDRMSDAPRDRVAVAQD
jgi:CRP-like cAMP-binding protein